MKKHMMIKKMMKYVLLLLERPAVPHAHQGVRVQGCQLCPAPRYELLWVATGLHENQGLLENQCKRSDLQDEMCPENGVGDVHLHGFVRACGRRAEDHGEAQVVEEEAQVGEQMSARLPLLAARG